METLLMIKPDTVADGRWGEIVQFVLNNGFNIVDLKMRRFDKASAEDFYGVHRERDFFNDLVEYITSGPVVAMRIEGDGVIEAIRAFIGPTDPANASPGTVRRMYGASLQYNAVHASDSAESSKKELAIVFGGS
jgi:nucleoside-diphosphate kinase